MLHPPTTPPSHPLHRYFLPVLLWGLVIAVMSLGLFSGGVTERMLAATAQFFYPEISPRALAGVNAVLRKGAHVAEYMVFALLVWRLLERGAEARWRTSRAAATAALGMLVAGADEFHQLYTRGRAGSVTDVAWDALGVALALGCLYVRAQGEEKNGKAPFDTAQDKQGLVPPDCG